MKHKRWTDEEKLFLIDNAGKLTDDEFAEELGRDIKSIQNKRWQLDLPVKRKVKIYEVVRGHEILAEGTIIECAAQLGLKPDTVMFYATQAHYRRLKNLDKSVIAIRVD